MQGRGINAHIPSKSDIDKVVQCGCEWIRLDFDWRTIEPKKGNFNWGPYDTAVQYANSKNLKIYATLAYVPTWVNSNYRACPDVFNWVYFCTKVGARYGKRITIYSLWNEPNLKQFYIGSKNDYVNIILKSGWSALKSIDGGALTVAAGDLATVSGSDWYSWFKLLKKHTDLFDVFSWHTYQSSADKIVSRYKFGRFPIIGWLIPKWRPFKWCIKDIKKKGKPIFLTETGLKARSNKSSELKKQQKFVSKLDKVRKETDADAVFIYDLKDWPQFKDKWGIFDEHGSPKKSAQWLMGNK